MESVGIQVESRAELDELMVALLQRRDHVEAKEAALIDKLIGKINWDVAADQLEVTA